MLREEISKALKEAMKNREERAVSTYRLIMAALKDRDIVARGKGLTEGVSEEEILSMLQSMIKQRNDSIVLYKQGGREELAAQEQQEIDYIKAFMPEQMSEDDMSKAIAQTITEIGAENMRDMGKVMNEIRVKYSGRMDFAKASQMIKSALNG